MCVKWGLFGKKIALVVVVLAMGIFGMQTYAFSGHEEDDTAKEAVGDDAVKASVDEAQKSEREVEIEASREALEKLDELDEVEILGEP